MDSNTNQLVAVLTNKFDVAPESNKWNETTNLFSLHTVKILLRTCNTYEISKFY